MTTKPNIQAVQTPAGILRAAIANRESISQEIEGLQMKAAMFAPIEAAAAAAEAELQRVLQADADAMRAWAADGANGPAPEPSQKAREDATRKVSIERAKLSAAGGAQAHFQNDLVRAGQRHNEAQAAEKEAYRCVVGQELLRKAQSMKDARQRYLVEENRYSLVKRAALDMGGLEHVFNQAAEIARPIFPPDEVKIADSARLAYEKRMYALARGDDPGDE